MAFCKGSGSSRCSQASKGQARQISRWHLEERKRSAATAHRIARKARQECVCSNTHGPTVQVQRRLKIHPTKFYAVNLKRAEQSGPKIERFGFKSKRKVMGILSFISSSTVHLTSFFPQSCRNVGSPLKVLL